MPPANLMADLGTLPTHSSFPQRIPSALKWVLFPLSSHSSIHLPPAAKAQRSSAFRLSDTYSFQHQCGKRKELQEATTLRTKGQMCPELRYTLFLGIVGRGGRRPKLMNARKFPCTLQCMMVWVYTAGNRGMSQTCHGSSVVLNWNGAGSRSVCQNRCLLHMSDQLYLASIADFFFN